ncbi:putative methylesterase 19 [Asimina triloba]
MKPPSTEFLASILYQCSPPEEDFQRWIIRNNPPKEVKEIDGADHMVMMSKPQELCQCLLEMAENYA